MTARRRPLASVQQAAIAAGFTPIEQPGIRAFRRRHPDGRTQYLGLIQWSNPRVAARHGIPKAYLAVCIGLEAAYEDSTRMRLPLVEWPSETQEARRAEDVVEEFAEIFLTAYDAPADEGRRLLLAAPARNDLYSTGV